MSDNVPLNFEALNLCAALRSYAPFKTFCQGKDSSQLLAALESKIAGGESPQLESSAPFCEFVAELDLTPAESLEVLRAYSESKKSEALQAAHAQFAPICEKTAGRIPSHWETLITLAARQIAETVVQQQLFGGRVFCNAGLPCGRVPPSLDHLVMVLLPRVRASLELNIERADEVPDELN